MLTSGIVAWLVVAVVVLVAGLFVYLFDGKDDRGFWLNTFERNNKIDKELTEKSRKATDTNLNYLDD